MKGEAPDQDGDGFFNTQLPVIIFQMMEQNVSDVLSLDTLRYVVRRLS